MSFGDYGYEPETLDTILGRIINNILSAVPDMAMDPSSIVYQWAKILAYEIYTMETSIENFTANMTVVGADEFYTSIHGAELGIFRKVAVPATGYVKAKAAVGTRVPGGTEFWTSTGVYFESEDDVEWTDNITMIRGRNESDGIPFAYPDFVPEAIYSDQTMASGTEIDSGAWWYESGAIWWKTHDATYSGSVPAYGSYYYVTPSGGEYYINIKVSATEGGTDGNVGANTITQYDTTAVTGTLSDVGNDSAFTTGIDTEELSEYKRRILEAKRVPTSLGYISSLVNQVNSVKYASLYEITNDDIAVPSGWTSMSGYTNYIALDDSGSTYSFTFSPSDGVATLKGITTWMNATGTPGNLRTYICIDNGTEQDPDDALKEVSVDLGVLNKSGRTTPQSVFIPLKYNGISKTITYRVFIKPENCDSGNHWNWYTVGSDYSEITSYSGNTALSGDDFIVKTHYSAPAFNIVLQPYDGYEFETVRDEVEEAIEDHVPVGIQYDVVEAVKVYLSLRVDIKLEDGADFDGVKEEIIANLNSYISSLSPGDDVIYSKVEKAILNVDGVFKEKNLEIWINDNPHSTPSDEMDQFVDYDEIVVLDTAGYYGGVTISEVPT